MLVIGITGGIGSGKSTACNIIRDWGYRVIDADRISKELTMKQGPVIEEIRRQFGDEFIDGESLNRPLMAKLIFSKDDMREKLENIVFKGIFEGIEREMEDSLKRGDSAVFLDIPLLFETGWDDKCDGVWLITADEKTRIKRVMKRDNATANQVMARMKTQMPEVEKARLADYVIDNSYDIEALKKNLEEVRSHYEGL